MFDEEIARANPGKRMLLAMQLPVSWPARRVAMVLAYHGWSACTYPSGRVLAQLARVKFGNLPRALDELQEAGVLSRVKRYMGRGKVATEYTFRTGAFVEMVKALDTSLEEPQ